MKKVLLTLMGCLLAFGMLAQDEGLSKQLKETRVEPPRFDEKVEVIAQEMKQKPSAISQYIQEELIIPEVEYGYYNEGVVAVEFTVEADRSVSNFMVTNSVSDELDYAVISCLEETNGMWIPGKVNGEYTSMQKKVYVKFDIEGNPSHTEMARYYYMLGTDLYKKALANKEGIHPRSANKAKRQLKRALYNLDDALRYKPEDPSTIILQAFVYNQQGDVIKTQQKLSEYEEVLDAIAVRSLTGDELDMAIITL